MKKVKAESIDFAFFILNLIFCSNMQFLKNKMLLLQKRNETMKRVYFLGAIVAAMLTSCSNISNASVSDIEKACEKGDWATAKKMCEGYVKKDRTNPVVFKCLGDAYLGLKDSTFANYSYGLALELDSTYVDAMVGSADILMNGGAVSKAISNLRSQIETVPENSKLYTALGCAFRMDGNINEAQSCFERAVLLDQYYVPARRNLALIQIDNEDFDDAIVNLETLIDQNPNQADVYNYLGLAYAFENKKEEAEKMFLKSISVDGKYVSAVENLAYHYSSSGNLKQAKKYYEKAAELGSVNAQNLLKKHKFNK